MDTPEQVINRLFQWAGNRSIAVIGLGNRDRADDGFGLLVAERLKKRYPDRVLSEENRHVEGIVMELLEREEVEVVLFLDALHFGGAPGELKLFDADDADAITPAFSTHKVPITFLMQLLEQHEKQPLLLGVQPEQIDLFGTLSIPIQAMIRLLTEKLEVLMMQDSK